MEQAVAADTVSPGAALPANLTVPGGAGCSAALPFVVAAAPGQTVLTVGTGEEYQTIAAAVAAAGNGDLILVQPGTYTNDFATINAQVTIAGAGGLVNMVATEAPPNEKGFFVVNNNVEVDNFVFTGAAIPDGEGGNAAGIRYQGGAMVLNNDAFIANQDGILAAAVDNLPVNSIVINHSTFDNNGNATGEYAGYTHNCYIGSGVTTLTATGNVFERANVGHELKSRAAVNSITGNIFYDGPTGTASYDIDLPNGGADTISGNIIEKGPHAENNALIHFGGEGIPYAGSGLLVTGNQLINDLGNGAVGVLNQTTLQADIVGNRFNYFEHATIGQGLYAASGNIDDHGNAIADSQSGTFAPGTNIYDFSHDSNAHSIVLTSAAGVLGGSGLLTVMADAGHVTVLGGSGGLTFQEAPNEGGSYIATAAGAHDTVSLHGEDTVVSAGYDTILGGAGNLTVQVSGHAGITSGTGSNQYVVSGQASIAGGGGADTVQVNGGAVSVTGVETYLQVTMNGGSAGINVDQGGVAEQATITGGASATRIYGGGINVTTAGGSAGTQIAFGAGTANLMSGGSDTIQAGSGADTVIVTASAQIHAGGGALSVFGRSETGQASVYGAGGTVMIGGDTGDISYFGGAATNTVDAAVSNVTLQGGSGLMNVQGGSRQFVSGGSGGLIFATGGGADTIATSAGAADSISFTGACSVISNGNDQIAAGQGNAIITANGNATITGSTGNASYALNGADSLSAYGYTRATIGAGAQDTVTAYGSVTSLALSGGTVVFGEVANADREAATVSGSGASIWSNAASASTSITLGGTGDKATLGGGQIVVAANAAGCQITAGAGAATVDIYRGGGVLHAGAGSVNIGLFDGSDQAVTTIFGAGGSLALQAGGSGNLVFVGGAGTASIGGTGGGETVIAGSGNISLVGGGSGTNFVAGTGNAAVTLTSHGGTVVFGTAATMVTEAGYGAACIFQFNAGQGGGTDTIAGFRTGTDQLQFHGVSVTSDVVSGGSTQLTLSNGTSVTLLSQQAAMALHVPALISPVGSPGPS